jgi:hypothetical protein
MVTIRLSYLLLHNKLLKTQWLTTAGFLIFSQFYESAMWPELSWMVLLLVFPLASQVLYSPDTLIRDECSVMASFPTLAFVAD